MLLLMLGGLYLFPTRTVLHTQLYVFFFLPAIIFLLREIVLRRIELLQLDWLMLAFGGSFAVSAFYPGAVAHEKHWLFVATVLVAYLGLSRLPLLLGDRMPLLLKTAALLVAASCLVQMYVYHVYGNHSFEYRQCCVLSLQNPLYEAQAIGFFLTLAIFGVMTTAGRGRLLFVLAALVMFGFGFQTYSRSFFVAMVFLAGWLALVRVRSRTQLIALIVVVLALVQVAGLLVLQDRGFSRVDIWIEAIKLIGQQPLFGYGSGYPVDIRVLYDNDPNHWISQRHWRDSHNLFLSLWLLYGVPCLLAFLALVAGLLRAGWRYRHDAMMQVFCASLVFGIAILCFEGGSIFSKVNSKWPALWFPISLIVYRVHALRVQASRASS